MHGGGGAYQGPGGTAFGSTAHPNGDTYGNSLLLPLVGGSGGGGAGRTQAVGGGGAILIAATSGITLTGSIAANGAQGINRSNGPADAGGSGSGGAVRLVAPVVSVSGSISAVGAGSLEGQSGWGRAGGRGRVRLEGDITGFSGTIAGSQSTSSAPGILILPAGVLPLLTISSVGGVIAPGAPSGDLLNPDIVFDPAATNPMAVVVDAQNLDPATLVTVDVRPEHGPIVTASGALVGTVETSSVTISMDLPAGAGVLFARAVNGVTAKTVTASTSFSETGLAPNGERFAKVEVVAALGGAPQAVYVTPSGRRFLAPVGE